VKGDALNGFAEWVVDLERRHMADLTFAEVARSVRALSATYVERRVGIGRGRALEGAGKRAAFALYYAPMHFLLVREIVGTLERADVSVLTPAPETPASTVVDLGCGSGAAGAAWAAQYDPAARRVIGIDRHPWATREAANTYRAFGLPARTRVCDVATVDLPRHRAAIVAAFVINELPDVAREALLDRLVTRAAQGDRLLIVEPLAGFVAPWWRRWQTRVESEGGRADEWRVRPDLPDIVRKLDRAAGLRHDAISGRSLWMPGCTTGTRRPRSSG
jgi:SAM-dependent methyltransferase